ncbi:MAG: pyridoxamine 5'-phosphate oxidase family protein [Oscillospiraceae bacterium]
MFQQMRRKDREIPEEQARNILEKGEWGVLSTVNAEEWPCGTPLSYVLLGGSIYFHSAQSGQKISNLQARPKVCFSVVGRTLPVYDGSFTTLYESAMAFGLAAEVESSEEKVQALVALCQKYLPQEMGRAEASLKAGLPRTAVWKIEIQHLTGKQRRLEKGTGK